LGEIFSNTLELGPIPLEGFEIFSNTFEGEKRAPGENILSGPNKSHFSGLYRDISHRGVKNP